MLWQKESNTTLYVDLSPNVISVADFRFNSAKNNTLSLLARNEGNQKYSRKDFKGAMNKYNESIRFAENGSECLALAYGNRSSCFFSLHLYDQCLVDIQLAKDANYPENLMTKLDDRKQKSLLKLKSTAKISSSQPLLSFEADDKLPCMANVLQIERNDEYGRFITAKQDIKIGETVLVEDAYVSKSYGPELKKCTNCAKTEGNFIPCKNCNGAMYCSEKCADNMFHDGECDIVFSSNDCVNGESLSFVLRSVIIGINTFRTINEMIEFVEDCLESRYNEISESVGLPIAKYRTFFKLASSVSNKQKYDFHKSSYIIFRAIMGSKHGVQFRTEETQRFLIHLVAHHWLIIHVNSFGGFSKSLSELEESTTDRYDENEYDRLQYLIASYFNHSCTPNIIKISKGTMAVCKAVLPIKKGDQLFITYIATDVFDTQKEVNDHLESHYGFRCKCEICVNGILTEPRLQDPNFQYVRANLGKLVGNVDLGLLLEMKKRCIAFLLKFPNMTHTMEGRFIAHNLGAILEKELE